MVDAISQGRMAGALIDLGALNWFYASEVAGIENVKLYPESVTGWLADGGVLAAPATQEY